MDFLRDGELLKRSDIVSECSNMINEFLSSSDIYSDLDLTLLIFDYWVGYVYNCFVILFNLPTHIVKFYFAKFLYF
ncbi:hypothetical protein YC2023_037471 [Brassica napus]